MTSFLITGDGYPAYRVLKAVSEMPAVSVAGVILGSSSSVKAEAFAKSEGLRILPRSILKGREPIPEGVSADWLVNINGTTILAPEIIALFPSRAINMHPGLLPQYAGLHCHQWAIRNGEHVQGLTVHIMDDRIDTGPILAQTNIPIFAHDTGLSLFRRTMEAGTALMIEVLARIVANDIPNATPQDISRRRFYRHRDALEDAVDWTWHAHKIVNFVRAANYEPLACPTYTPTAVIAGLNYTLRSCMAVEANVALEPGTLMSLTADGPIVASGFGEAILVTRALHDGVVVTLGKWQEVLSSQQ
jgi:methionyl-tRNA formyltransferase